jgi:flagellar basal-body rod modification protein FlgD
MQITATPSTTAASGTIVMQGADPASSKKTLGSDDFLKLLSAQLNAQDPMDPMKDTDFIAQMASFTSVEQTSALNQSFTTFSDNQRLANAAALLGRTVTLTDPQAGTVTGSVQAAALQDGAPTVIIGGKPYDASLITKIATS